MYLYERKKYLHDYTAKYTIRDAPRTDRAVFFNIVSKGSGGGGASRPMIKIVDAIFYNSIIVSRNCLETAVSD